MGQPMHFWLLNEGQSRHLPLIPHGGSVDLAGLRITGTISSFSAVMMMLKSTSLTDGLERMCPLTMASNVATLSLKNSKHRLFLPETVNPLAKYGQPWNMPRISSGFVDETSTLARYSPSIVLSWFDQKAMAIVYTLLALVIKNVRVGPTLPAFVSQKNWKFIQDNYGWMPIGDVDADLRAMLKN